MCGMHNKSNFNIIILCTFIFNFSQELVTDSTLTYDVIRPGKDPNVLFSSGIIVKITCKKPFASNLASNNDTAKCVKGIWKPEKPTCISGKVNSTKANQNNLLF